MTLVAIANLETESQVVVATSLLVAHDIPHFVQGAGFGGLFPGPQIGSYNSRRLLVPQSSAVEATELLSDLLRQPDSTLPEVVVKPLGFWPKLRIVLEVLILGWFVPRRR